MHLKFDKIISRVLKLPYVFFPISFSRALRLRPFAPRAYDWFSFVSHAAARERIRGEKYAIKYRATQTRLRVRFSCGGDRPDIIVSPVIFKQRVDDIPGISHLRFTLRLAKKERERESGERTGVRGVNVNDEWNFRGRFGLWNHPQIRPENSIATNKFPIPRETCDATGWNPASGKTLKSAWNF